MVSCCCLPCPAPHRLLTLSGCPATAGAPRAPATSISRAPPAGRGHPPPLSAHQSTPPFSAHHQAVGFRPPAITCTVAPSYPARSPQPSPRTTLQLIPFSPAASLHAHLLRCFSSGVSPGFSRRRSAQPTYATTRVGVCQGNFNEFS